MGLTISSQRLMTEPTGCILRITHFSDGMLSFWLPYWSRTKIKRLVIHRRRRLCLILLSRIMSCLFLLLCDERPLYFIGEWLQYSERLSQGTQARQSSEVIQMYA